MNAKMYKKQVLFLLSILPEIEKESCFAMYGGTAINLFLLDMPRLSIDIDLLYLPIEDREVTLQNITAALNRVKNKMLLKVPSLLVRGPLDTPLESKLFFRLQDGVQVKVEVNTTMRGSLGDPSLKPICQAAQITFGEYSEMLIVPTGQLYGGKCCAALERQHPRDIFDIKYMMQTEGLSSEIKRGLLLCLLCSDRPTHETISPNHLDQRKIIDSHFNGMTDEIFDYSEFERVRADFFHLILGCFSANEKEFLMSFNSGKPDWQKFGFLDFEKFPSIQWKLLNINKLKNNNPNKYNNQLNALEKVLGNG